MDKKYVEFRPMQTNLEYIKSLSFEGVEDRDVSLYVESDGYGGGDIVISYLKDKSPEEIAQEKVLEEERQRREWGQAKSTYERLKKIYEGK